MNQRLMVIALAALAGSGWAPAEEPGQQGEVWNLGTLEPGRQYATTLSAFNESCKGRHTFEFSVEDAPWLRITGSPAVEAQRGQTSTTQAVVDVGGLPAGEHRGRLVIRCPTCPPSCRQDYRSLAVVVTVAGGEEPAPAAAGLSLGLPREAVEPGATAAVVVEASLGEGERLECLFDGEPIAARPVYRAAGGVQGFLVEPRASFADGNLEVRVVGAADGVPRTTATATLPVAAAELAARNLPPGAVVPAHQLFGSPAGLIGCAGELEHFEAGDELGPLAGEPLPAIALELRPVAGLTLNPDSLTARAVVNGRPAVASNVSVWSAGPGRPVEILVVPAVHPTGQAGEEDSGAALERLGLEPGENTIQIDCAVDAAGEPPAAGEPAPAGRLERSVTLRLEVVERFDRASYNRRLNQQLEQHGGEVDVDAVLDEERRRLTALAGPPGIDELAAAALARLQHDCREQREALPAPDCDPEALRAALEAAEAALADARAGLPDAQAGVAEAGAALDRALSLAAVNFGGVMGGTAATINGIGVSDRAIQVMTSGSDVGNALVETLRRVGAARRTLSQAEAALAALEAEIAGLEGKADAARQALDDCLAAWAAYDAAQAEQEALWRAAEEELEKRRQEAAEEAARPPAGGGTEPPPGGEPAGGGSQPPGGGGAQPEPPAPGGGPPVPEPGGGTSEALPDACLQGFAKFVERVGRVDPASGQELLKWSAKAGNVGLKAAASTMKAWALGRSAGPAIGGSLAMSGITAGYAAFASYVGSVAQAAGVRVVSKRAATLQVLTYVTELGPRKWKYVERGTYTAFLLRNPDGTTTVFQHNLSSGLTVTSVAAMR